MAHPPNNSKTQESDLPIPPALQKKLEDFQHGLWSVKIAEGALAGLFGLGISYLVVFGLDRVFDTPGWLRIAILATGFAAPAIGIPLRFHRWVWKQRSLEQVARLLRRKFPRLGDELLGIVELARIPSQQNSEVLVAAAMKQVDARVRDQQFDEAVPDNHYGSWLMASFAVLGLVGLLLFLASDAAKNSLARWVSPWKPVDRYTFAQLEPLPDKIVVPFAENFDITPELAESTEWSPDSATMKLPGSTRLSSDREDAGYYSFAVPPQKQNSALSLRVGDARERIEVKPLPRPELTELSAVVRLPDYLLYESDPVIPVRGGAVSILEGATAVFSAKTSRELARADTDGQPTSVEGAGFSTRPLKVEDPIKTTISWSDIHGLEAKSPLELSINPIEDGEPDIFASPLSTEQVVLEDETVSFDISAVDDFGVKLIGLEWHGVPDARRYKEPAEGEKTVAAGAPEQIQIETRGTFSAAREGIEPQTVEIRAFAEDYLPDRERSYSPTFVLHILSPDDHAAWLTEQFGKWFRNAREVYENEQQLFETNRNLRELSPEELDRPENRRRLQDQASAESSNARRLDSLTKSGRDLVRQATKNDEFDAERLESWATMMRALDEIAKQRMPSVADLLQQSSRAEGGKKPSAPNVSENRSTQKESGDSGGEPEDNPPSQPVPSISDQESSLTKGESKPTESGEKKSGSGALRLPSTSLASAGGEDEDEPPAAETPAQEKLDEALVEQEDLLAEFAKIADQLQEILSSLEASTFVKRFKAASRKQFEIADTLNQTLDGAFGLPRHRIEQQFRDVGKQTADAEENESNTVYQIQSDLEAYFQRKQDVVFKNVLDQMKDLAVVPNLKAIGEESLVNLNGRSISAAEYWGDTLDRWAEELVSASECKSCQGGSKESLPPEIVLEVMKVLKEEMELRDETREIEATRPILAPDVFTAKVLPLELTQENLRERIDSILTDIEELPDSRKHFGKELQLLTMVSDIMREARGILARPDTGPEAVAAETEIIELLLQSQRQPPSSGGGGGGSSPGGGGAGGGTPASLTDIAGAAAGEDGSAPLARDVDQSTGKAGRELPEEFRRGLDTYFNALESSR